jgi:hypothetical protein
MSNPQPSDTRPAESDRAAEQSSLFAQLVIQQTNLATMLLGKTPHPESGKVVQDLEAAKLFIDQLEMLEAKTRGNLSKPETALLQQALMSLRLAFVETVNAAPPAPAPAQAQPGAAQTPPAQAPSPPPPPEEESHRKFSKKY